MANGIQQLRRELRESSLPDRLDLQEWLDPFYRGRIGIRLLLGHHIGKLHRWPTPTRPCGSPAAPARHSPRRRHDTNPAGRGGACVTCKRGSALTSGSQEGHIGMVAPQYVAGEERVAVETRAVMCQLTTVACRRCSAGAARRAPRIQLSDP